MSKTYLVTGCAGFIASQVCQQLLAAGERVVGVDNLSDAYDPRLKSWRLQALQRQTNFEYHPTDITDFFALKEIFDRQSTSQQPPFVAVLNMAARAGVRPSVIDPWIYFKVNTDGTLNLLELCRKYQVPKFVLSSTSSLYGAHNPIPFAEDADTNRPLSPYAASKKGAEAICYTYHHLHKLDVTVLRYFTVYGPAGRPDMSIFRFIRWIATGQPITIFGDGSQQRDFTFVNDIARGTIAATKAVGYEVINLGGDRSVSLLEIIQRLEKLIGKPAKLVHRPIHLADVQATWANITKAETLLNWRPQTTLEEGLAASVNWYFDHQDLANALSLGEI
jgi:UDP-glucuronate 4-epimerase